MTVGPGIKPGLLDPAAKLATGARGLMRKD